MADAQVGSDVTREEFRELAGTVRELQRRIEALEHAVPLKSTELPPPPLPDVHVSSEFVPAIGKALLAIAGAFLLRAMTEAHLLPSKPGVFGGLVYAAFWMGRALSRKPKMPAVVDAITSLAIFIPLIGEAVLRIQAMPPWMGAAAVAAWSIAPVRRREIAALASAAGAVTGLVLLVATRDLLPFSIALLAIAAVADCATLSARWIAAFCATAAVGIQTFLVGQGLPDGYAPVSRGETIAVQAASLIALATTCIVRGVLRREVLSYYEIGKTVMAFCVSAGGMLYLTHANAGVGWFSAAVGAGCFVAALRGHLPSRNTQTFGAFGALLAVAAALLILPASFAAMAMCGLAVAVAWTDLGTVQAPATLWAAMWVSGVAAGSARALFDSGRELEKLAAVVIVAASVVVYSRMRKPGAGFAVAAAAVWTSAGLAARFGAGDVALPLAAVGLASSRRRDVVWAAHACMVAGAAKIVLHDFSQESTLGQVRALVAYGAGLILVSRLVQKVRRIE
jgi:hypothetical protein